MYFVVVVVFYVVGNKIVVDKSLREAKTVTTTTTTTTTTTRTREYVGEQSILYIVVEIRATSSDESRRPCHLRLHQHCLISFYIIF